MLIRCLVISIALALAACGGADEGEPASVQASTVAKTERRTIQQSTAASAAPYECETFAEELLAWPETVTEFKEYFSGGSIQFEGFTYQGDTYTVRWYPNLDNYLGVREDGQVFGYGRYTGFTLVNFGHMHDYACAVKEASYGHKRILVAHVKFSDTKTDPFPIADTVARVEKVAAFFEEISYGRSTQTYNVLPTWITLPQPRVHYENNGGIDFFAARKSLELLAQAQTDAFMGADIVAIFLPGMKFAGLAYRDAVEVGQSFMVKGVAVLSADTLHDIVASTFAHELLHVYSLPTAPLIFHSGAFACENWTHGVPTTFTDPTYQEIPCGPQRQDSQWIVYNSYTDYDIMGRLRGHPNSYWKYRLGWLRPAQVRQVMENQQVNLAPYEEKSAAIQAVRIPLGNDQAGKPVSYWAEYRTQLPQYVIRNENTSDLPWRADRVKVWVNLPNVPMAPIEKLGIFAAGDARVFTYEKNGDDPATTDLAIGETFHDPYRGVRIRRGQNVGTSAQVTVEVSEITISDPIGVVLSPTANRVITVTNTGKTAVMFSETAALKGRTPEAFRLTGDTCSRRSLPAGGSCAYTVSHVRTGGTDEQFFAYLALGRTSDPVRVTPTVGLIGTP